MCVSVYVCVDVFDLVNPYIAKARPISEKMGIGKKPFPLQIKPSSRCKAKLADFYFCSIGNNWLK